MLCSRAAKVNASNMGGDAPLHIAVSFGQQEILYKVWDLHMSLLIRNWLTSVQAYIFTEIDHFGREE